MEFVNENDSQSDRGRRARLPVGSQTPPARVQANLRQGDAVATETARRYNWPAWLGLVALVAAGLRAYLNVGTQQTLGEAFSCGNAFGYMTNGDKHAGQLAMALCGPSLQNAATETVVLLIAAGLLLMWGLARHLGE